MISVDWNLARAFYATAKAGSLSAAARRLGLTQPTLSRQVALLETELGVTLFERIGKRLVLTETGQSLVAHGQAMGDAADAMALAASGRAQAVEGRVSISATDAYSAYILPDICARIRKEAPHVTLVIISSNALSDLRRREADIAIRHVRPDEPDLIGQLVRESTACFYASESWLARNGAPQRAEDIKPHDLIGYDDTAVFAQYMCQLGMAVTADSFRLVSENTVVAWEMVKRGHGIGVMMPEIAERTPGVVKLLPHLQLPRVPVWLVTHRELRTSQRIRLVFDVLAEELRGEALSQK
jgi:DNA-binding transcriptional LysR family regulator